MGKCEAGLKLPNMNVAKNQISYTILNQHYLNELKRSYNNNSIRGFDKKYI